MPWMLEKGESTHSGYVFVGGWGADGWGLPEMTLNLWFERRVEIPFVKGEGLEGWKTGGKF